MSRILLAAVAIIGALCSAAAVAGVWIGAFGLWPALALVALGWGAAAVMFLKSAPGGGGTQARMPTGIRLDERDFADGDMIIREGDAATSLYLVIAGKVQVWRQDEYGSRIDIAELVPGQIFGEMGLLNGGARTASVEAVGDVRTFEVPREMFEALIAESGSVATMIRGIAERRRAG